MPTDLRVTRLIVAADRLRAAYVRTMRPNPDVPLFVSERENAAFVEWEVARAEAEKIEEPRK